MSINNCQAIQKSCIDRKSYTLFTSRLRERDLRFIRAVTVFKLLNDRQSEFRESSVPIMHMLFYRMFTEIFIISMWVCRIARSWHPSRVSVFPVKPIWFPGLSLEGRRGVRLAIYTALLERLAVVNRHMIVRNWIGSNYGTAGHLAI